MAIIITLLAIGVVIFIHEFGHLLGAKRAGIGVLEFSIGMGPAVYQHQIKETIYSLRLFPFGGFVKLAGLDDEHNDPSPVDIRFQSKPPLARVITIAAGSLSNIIFGCLLYFFIFSVVGIPRLTNQIDRVLPNSPAAKAGLQSGDRITHLNNTPISNIETDFISFVKQSGGRPLDIIYYRNDRPKSLAITPTQLPDTSSDSPLIGVIFSVSPKRQNPIYAAYYSLRETAHHVQLVFVSLKMLITRQATINDIAGPIGIIQLASFQFHRGLLYFLNIIGMISISLGIINLFPFPVLDGGHLVLLLIESITHRPINKHIERLVNQAGAAVLITLMGLVVLNDIIHWSSRIQLLQQLTKSL